MSDYSYGPLPVEAFKHIPNVNRANKGLVFERFFQGYNHSFTEISPGSKAIALQRCAGRCGDNTALESAKGRTLKLTQALSGQCMVFKTDWYLVTGMGNNNPVENGFSWHRTLGTPYLPGSTIKGMLRAWLSGYASERFSASELNRWFGGTDQETGAEQAGELIFFDALPLEPPELAVDIMTPHQGKWYEQGAERQNKDTIPGDWHAPVPVPFLVTSNASFMFAIAPRAGSQIALEPVFEALEQALNWTGIGAKTAAGYGHMSRVASASEQLQTQLLSEQAQLLKQLEDGFAQESKHGPIANSEMRILLEQQLNNPALSEWPLTDREALLEVAQTILRFHDQKNWNKLTKKKKPSLFMKLKTHLGLDKP